MMMFFMFFFILQLFFLLWLVFLVLIKHDLLDSDKFRKVLNITGLFNMMSTVMNKIKLLLNNYLINPIVRFLKFLFKKLNYKKFFFYFMSTSFLIFWNLLFMFIAVSFNGGPVDIIEFFFC